MSEPLPDRAFEKLLAIAAESTPGTDAPAPLPDLPPRYRILREIGRGGMGVVYEASDELLGRRCAVKVLGAAVGPGDELHARFAREALAAARLRHPNIAAIYDAAPGYISMQLVHGEPITAVPAADLRLLVELIRDAARAVHHAHGEGIVHRDLKPSNLLVEGRRVFVVDFGLAKEVAAGSDRSASAALLGTPAYMPPEQARGGGASVDVRSDVWALGATLYHCATGAPPFLADDLAALLRRILEDEPRPPSLEGDLDLVILKCLAKDKERRYASALELADDLDRWLRNEPVLARRPSLAYRLKKLAQRRRAVLRAAGAAALVTALVLVPIALRESAARAAAGAAVAFSEHAAAVAKDASGFLRLGDIPSAHKALDVCIAEARAFLARHEVARVRHVLSRLLRARGKPEEALAELQLAIAGEPSLADARFERGLMLAALREPTDAERLTALADLATPIGPRSVLTSTDRLLGQAELLRLDGQPARAREVLEEVLAYEPANVAARVALSRAALALGDTGLARYYAASAFDLQQGFGPIYLARERRELPTRILGLDQALVDFAPLIAEGPDHAIALASRGLVHLRRALRLERDGERADALAAVLAATQDHDETLRVHPKLAGAYVNRAVCLAQAERLHAATGDSAAAAAARSQAEADLAQALALDPASPEAHFDVALLALRAAALARRLGRAAAATQRLDEALGSLRMTLACAPERWPHLRACQAALAEAESARARGG